MSLKDDILIENFLRGNLSKEEELLFNKRVKEEKGFKEKVHIEKQLFETLNKNSWSFSESGSSNELQEYKSVLESEETNILNKKILNAKANYSEIKKRKTPRLIFLAAAAITLIFIVVFSFFNESKSTHHLYAVYMNTSDLPTLATRGFDDENSLVLAQQYFEGKEYSKVISTLSTTKEKSAMKLLYTGVSHLELNNFVKAEENFNALISSDFLDASMGYWYKALLFVKADKKEDAIKMLENIIEHKYFNYKSAEKLLKELG